jgi:hypothetical protein
MGMLLLAMGGVAVAALTFQFYCYLNALKEGKS